MFIFRRNITKFISYILRWSYTEFSTSTYGSTVLVGLPKQLLDKLQSVQDAAARLVFAANRNDHITPLLHNLQWLRVAERITFRLAVLTYLFLHGSAPEYLTSLLQCVFDVHTRQLLRSASSILTWLCHGQFAPPSVNGLSSQQSAAVSTLNALPRSVRSSISVFQFSIVDSRQNCSRVHTSNLSASLSASLWLTNFVLWIYVTLMTILILTD